MLAEFFLTPDAFCESDERLRQLQTCLFPFGPNASVGVICHFGEDEWDKIVSRRIYGIRDQDQRMLAMDLFKRIADEIAVFRPPLAAPPSDEAEWVKTAKQSKQALELDAFVVSHTIEPCPDECIRMTDFFTIGVLAGFRQPTIDWP